MTKTRNRLLWRLYMGRPVVVDQLILVDNLQRWTETPLKVDTFTDRRDGRVKYRLIKMGA